MEIFRLFGSIFIENEKANKSLQQTDQKAESVGKTLQNTIKAASKWGREMGKQLTTVGTNISKKAGVPLAALTALMGGLAKTTADYGDKVAKSAQEVGMTAVAYQELTYALGQNNLNAEESLRVFGRLNQRIGLARNGNEAYRKSLKKMGVDLDDLDKGLVGTEEAFGQIIEYLSEMEDSQLQAAYASDIFGTMLSRKMMPLIRSGAEGVDELRKRAHELGIVMDEEAAAKSELFGDTMDDLSRSVGGFNRVIGSELHAPLINIAKWITDIVAAGTNWIRENPKLVRQIIMFGGAIAGVLGVLVTLGTTLVITGKIIGALGAIFNILTSKPMLIIAAIGALYLAWESDWLGIRTAMENAWKVIEPILTTLWEWLGRAWDWAINIAGSAWAWLTETSWTDKIQEIKGWIDEAWTWTINTAGTVWDWLTETSWADKIEDIRNWLSNAWSWVLDLGGTAWAWIDENLPWLTDALTTVKNLLSQAWTWTINRLGDAWDWFKDSALVQWLDDLKQKITDSKAWQWTIDVALPAVIEGGKAVITAVVEAGGQMYDAIKKGLDSGDWSAFWSVTSDIWNAGVAIALSLQLVSGAASWVLTAIGSIFGNSAGKLGIGGIPLAIGLLTVGIQLMEAQAEGSYEAFVRNVLVAALVGAIGGAIFGPNGALIGFNLTLSLKLGTVLEDSAYALSEAMGVPKSHYEMLEEYEQYRQALIEEATKDMNWLQKRWWQVAGNKPEGLLSFEEWKQQRFGIVAVSDEVKELTGELSKLEKQSLIIAEVMKQGGTMEQAMAILGIAYWETRGHGGYTHTDPTTGEVIRGGAGEYGIGQVMPGTGKDVWTRLWGLPAETYDESVLEDLDTNIAMMVSYFLDRYRVYGEDLRLAIEGYNRGTAIDGMQAYTVGVVEWMEGAEGQSLANILYDGMENALEAMVQAGYDMDGDVREMAAFIAQSIADYLVGQSPPPLGPLSNIDEGGANVMGAWIEGAEDGLKDGVPTLTKMLNGIKGLFASVWDKVPDEIKEPIDQAMVYVSSLIEQAENALFKLDDLEDELEGVFGLGGSPEDEAKGFMAHLRDGLEEKLKTLSDPIDIFTSLVADASATLHTVIQTMKAGDWKTAILTVIMETESFAKAMELLGAVLAPVVALFDLVLKPIINGILSLWNGIIDALVSISIFGWQPFKGLKDKKIGLVGEGDKTELGQDKSSGGRQISEITGPTRDLLVDLLSPLANFGAIVAPIHDIRNILDTRLPNFNNLSMDFAGAGAMGPAVVIENLNVTAPTTGVDDISRATIDQIERALAGRIQFGIRGRGGR